MYGAGRMDMSLSLRIVGALLAALAWPSNDAVAQTAVQPFSPATGYALSSGTTKDSTGNWALYGSSTPSTAANWHFSLGGAPLDFAPLSNQTSLSASSNDWVAANNWATIHAVVNPDTSVTPSIATSGAGLPCTNSAGNPYELDVFSSPNGKNEAGFPLAIKTARYTVSSQFPALSKLTLFQIAGTYSLKGYWKPPATADCYQNQSGTRFEMGFTNKAKNQFLWYDIDFTHVCIPSDVYSNGSGSAYSRCVSAISRANPICVPNGPATYYISDVLPSYGYKSLQTVGSYNISLNVLPQISALIQSGMCGVDPVPGDWQFAGFNFGHTVWGKSFLSTQWIGLVPYWTQ